MKKLIMMCVALLMGMATQAATCTWTLQKITGLEGATAQTGWVAYIMDASTYDTFNALDVDKKAEFASNNNCFDTSVVYSRGYKVSFTGGDYSPNDTIDTYLVMFNNADASLATHYAVTGIASATVPASGSNASIAFGDFADATGGWQVVPEPTTGLLMLIGLAGLALRRKQA